MAVKKNEKNNKDVVISLRISAEDFSLFANKIETSKMSRSAFFRNIVLSKTNNINITVKNTDKLLYYFNKAGNNINQLAKNANIAYRNGKVSDKKYTMYLNVLINIESLLKKALDDAD